MEERLILLAFPLVTLAGTALAYYTGQIGPFAALGILAIILAVWAAIQSAA